MSNNICSDNESKTFEILMETVCSDLALSLRAPGEFRIPLAPTERGDKLLFRWLYSADLIPVIDDAPLSISPNPCSPNVRSQSVHVTNPIIHTAFLWCVLLSIPPAHVDFSDVNWPVLNIFLEVEFRCWRVILVIHSPHHKKRITFLS